jgi:hypothetical protein
MLRFWMLMGFAIVTLLALSGITWAQLSDADSHRVLGMAVVCTADQTATPCWIAYGGFGVVVLGGGVGMVEFGIGGVGILFGTGQLAAGLIAMGQVGMGLVFWAGQAGVGLTGIAQGMFGWVTIYQGGESGGGRRYFRALSQDMTDLCSFR